MKLVQKAIIARVLLFAAFWLSGCSFFSSPINISGQWSGHIEWTTGFPGIQTTLYLDLVHDDRDLSGSVWLGGPGGTSFELVISDGYARTHTMSLEASGTLAITPPQNVTLELDGDFHETQMSGTGTHTVNGTTYELIWEAVLVAPAVPTE